jgi:mRNA-degrading endonuclease RelE of RelBE toxin-antitoxin system
VRGTFDRDWQALDDKTKLKVLDAIEVLKKNPSSPALDLRPLGSNKSNTYTVRVEGGLRLSFKNIEGIAELRRILPDEIIATDPYA